jgi:hypothetical protein
MSFNLKSKFAKGQSVHGPGHDGVPKPGFYGDGAHVSHPHSVPNAARGMEHQETNPTLARGTGKPKRSAFEQVPIHSGMVSKNPNTGQFHFGGAEASRRALQGYKEPTDPPQSPSTQKTNGPVAINPGSRSRNADSLASENAGVAHARSKANGSEAALRELGQAVLRESRFGDWKG